METLNLELTKGAVNTISNYNFTFVEALLFVIAILAVAALVYMIKSNKSQYEKAIKELTEKNDKLNQDLQKLSAETASLQQKYQSVLSSYEKLSTNFNETIKANTDVLQRALRILEYKER